MTDEELQRKIEFIIEQQAQFTGDMQLLKESQVRLTAKVDTLTEIQANSETRLGRVEDSFVLLVQMAKLTDERLDILTNKTDTLSEKMEALAEAQRHTDERLNTFIEILERYISEGRNGKS
jgi:hypothetical protein